MKTLTILYTILSGRDPVCFWKKVSRHKNRKKSMKWLKRIKRIVIEDKPDTNTWDEIALWRAYRNATDGQLNLEKYLNDLKSNPAQSFFHPG